MSFFFRKTRADTSELELAELRRREGELERQRRQAEATARKAQKKKKDPGALLPPPDDLPDRRRERKFYAELASRGEVRNEIRAQTGNVFMLLILIAALGAVILWVIRALHGY